MKVKLTRVYRTDKNKDGEPLVSKKTGKPYTRCSIQTEEHGDKWVGGFGNETNAAWSEGDEVEITVEENGQWLNFKMPSDRITRKEFDALALRITLLEGGLHAVAETAVSSDRPEPPEQEENDLPF